MKDLPTEKKEAIEVAYQTTRNIHEKDRYQALRLLSQGYKRQEVAAILGKSHQALGEWVTTYHQKGLEGLREKRNTGNHRKLTREQKDQMTKILKEKTPEQCGYSGKFWTVEGLKTLVKDTQGVTYKSPQSYRNLFHDAGLSFHKPEKVHKNQSPYRRKRFEEELKKNSQSTGEKIVWYW
jgi:transposase